MRAKSYNDIHNIFTIPCEKSKIVSFTSSIMKSNNLLLSPSGFQVKSVCCIAFELTSSACCLLF